MTSKLPGVTELRRKRSEMRRQYKPLYDEVERVFFEHDPMHIGATRDEYDPEVEVLLPKLRNIRSERELADQIHAIFRDMFSVELAGPRDRYHAVARELWPLLQSTIDRIPAPG